MKKRKKRTKRVRASDKWRPPSSHGHWDACVTLGMAHDRRGQPLMSCDYRDFTRKGSALQIDWWKAETDKAGWTTITIRLRPEAAGKDEEGEGPHAATASLPYGKAGDSPFGYSLDGAPTT